MEGADKGRFRFSLRRFFVLLTLVVLAVSHLRTSYQFYLAEQELAKLRRETGYLQIGDPAAVHVAAVPFLDFETWRWRVTYRLCKQVNDVPAEGFPAAPAGDVLSPGEWMIELRIERAGNEKWDIRHHCRMERTLSRFGSQTVTSQGSGATLEGEPADWLDGRWVSMSQLAGNQRTEAFPIGQPICLLRHRADKSRVGTDDPLVCRGVLLWLTPE
jgi:hypothetical protein